MTEEAFRLVSEYTPTGDQPRAIAELVEGDPGNWKVTDAGDLERARQALERRA